MRLQTVPIAVAGAGTMGTGIAEIAALAGHQVLLADAEPAAPERALDEIAERQRRRVGQGKITGDQAEAAIANLATADPARMAGCGLVIEAVVEDMQTKVDLLTEVERHVEDQTVLASNTSSLSITALAAWLRRPERMVGLHFFNPVPAIRLVEVVNGVATDRDITGWLDELMRAWHKVPVQCASTPGFIVNRVARPFYGEAFRALSENAAAPAMIDRMLTDGGGFPMGPLRLADLIGQDVNQTANRSVWSALGYDPWFRPSTYQDQLVAAGRLGRKTGRGVYDYASALDGYTSAPDGDAGANGGAERAGVGSPQLFVGPEHPEAAGECHLYAPPGLTDPLLGELVDQVTGSGIQVFGDATIPPEMLRIRAADGVDALIAVTDGRPAAGRRIADVAASSTGPGGSGPPPAGASPELVQLDLVPGVADRCAVGVASSAGGDSPAGQNLITILNRAGLVGLPLADIPGLLLLRTVAMLINLAVEAAAAGVATSADIATAMQLGVRYPRDLYAWGDELGAERLVEFLDHLEDEHRDGHFRPCAALRHVARTGEPLETAAAL